MTQLTEAQEARFDQIVEEEMQKLPPPLNLNQAEQCRRQAVVFHLGAMRCMEEWPLPDGGYSQTTPPAVVNFAFACELYLKSILIYSTRSARGHDLYKLFDDLESAHKHAIRHKYEGLSGRKSQSLDLEMQRLSSAFVDWRYVYEGSSSIVVRLDRLVNITRTLFACCCDIVGFYSISPEIDSILIDPPSYSMYTIVSFADGRTLSAKTSI